jgi:hypothetical protein
LICAEQAFWTHVLQAVEPEVELLARQDPAAPPLLFPLPLLEHPSAATATTASAPRTAVFFLFMWFSPSAYRFSSHDPARCSQEAARTPIIVRFDGPKPPFAERRSAYIRAAEQVEMRISRNRERADRTIVNPKIGAS